MEFEAIPLYNKIILGSATTEEVRNKHVVQKEKKLGDQKRRHKNVRYVAALRGLLKKKINQ